MVLEGHHSRSVLPGRARRRLASLAGAMSRNNAGWWCEECRRSVKASANFCPTCGSAWGQTANTYASRQAWGDPRDWTAGWKQTPASGWQQRPKSPRKRSPGRHKGGKGKDATQPDGTQGKGKDKGKPASPAQAPTLESLPAPPTLPVGADKPGPPAPIPTEVSPEKAAYQQLLQLLAGQKESLPENVKQLVEQQSLAASQDNAKYLHKTVTAQAAARRELQKTRNARSSYMQAWSAYIGQLGTLLEEQIKTQQEQLELLDAQEMQWTGSLQEASATLARMANEGIKTEPREEEDMDMSEQKVDDAIALEQELQAQKEAQLKASQELLTALHATKAKAVEEAARAQKHATEGRGASRTPRRGGRQPDDAVPVDSSPDNPAAAKAETKLPAAALKPTPPQ